MIAKAIATAAILGSAGIGLPAPASADAADEQFLNNLASQQIYGDKSKLIAAGHGVCAEVGAGHHPLEFLNGVHVSEQYEVANLVVAALKFYCPQNAFMIEDILAEPGMAGNIQRGPDSAVTRFEEEERQQQEELIESGGRSGWYPGCSTWPMC